MLLFDLRQPVSGGGTGDTGGTAERKQAGSGGTGGGAGWHQQAASAIPVPPCTPPRTTRWQDFPFQCHLYHLYPAGGATSQRKITILPMVVAGLMLPGMPADRLDACF